MPTTNADDKALRRFRCILLLYPRAYRERYGQELEAFFVRQAAEERGGPRFWLRQWLDHGEAALAVRRRNGRGGGGMMEALKGLIHEVRLATRALRRAPTFAAFAIGTLALGVAATTTVFTILDRVVLRPLPYPESDRMVVVGSEFSHDLGGLGPLSVGQITDLIAAPGPAETVVGVTSIPKTISGLGDPERLPVNQISEGFFELLGARPALGRLLDDHDQRAGVERTVVIDHAFWQDRFGGSPEAIGRVFDIDDEPHVIVGVLSADFVRPESVAGNGPAWVPARFAEGETSRGAFSITALALLPPDVTPEVLDEYVDARFIELHDFLAGGIVREHRVHVVGGIADRLRGAFGGVVLLLLIACVNVASLTITRSQERERELSVRAALGAGRGRLVRQLAIESFLLAGAGGTLGAALAYGALELFRANAPPGIPRLTELSVDGWGLVFVVGLSLATLLVFGTLPALLAAWRAESGLTRADLRSTGGRRVAKVRAGLVLVETALAVVLVVGSGLLAKDLIRLSAEDRGFGREGLTSMGINLSGRVDGPEEVSEFWARLLAGAEALPGVAEATLTTQLPYDGVSTMRSLTPEGLAGDEDEVFVTTVSVTPNYFETLGIPIVEGRTIDASESGPGASVALVNEAFVQRFWPQGPAMGRQILSGGGMPDDEVSYSVIGVLADIRTRPGVAAPPQVYLPFTAGAPGRAELVVRTEGARRIAGDLRALARRMDPGLPIGRIETLTSLTSGTLDRPRFYTGLFGGFASVAFLLALVGVYGTTAYSMRSRTREIGIRLALGAARARLVRSVVTSTGQVLLGGVILGLAGAVLATRALSEVLLYVTPSDALTYGTVGALVLATGAVAAWIPASRSSRVDPATTLREE